ncbi:MAG: KEOPS complex kinase/ATPase Bud32 [Candidatus Altarchaeum sp.]|nr:KEOPS complex kinase/ATPase Bud32 [Candidatus Altarchaeum sp.]
MELIAKGAESNLYKDGKILIKERIKKDYRIREIDEKLRKKRTLSESKILKKLKKEKVNVPDIVKVDEQNFKIFMKFIDGNLMKDIEVENDKVQDDLTGIAKQLGRQIAKIHCLSIIHNDLTTSNIIISNDEENKEKKVYIIDFGLSFTSQRDEDKATDLVVLEHSLNTTGFGFLFEDVIAGYKEDYEKFGLSQKAAQTFKRFKEVKKRVRYFEEEM